MLSYQRVITNAVVKFPMSKWYEYDKRFRLKLSNDQSMSWDQVHTGLWLESFTSSASTSSQQLASTPDPQKGTTTKSFNDRRPCTYCGSVLHFPHSCQKAPFSFRNSRQVSISAPRAPCDQGGSRNHQSSAPTSSQKSGWCWQFNNTGTCKLGPQCQYFH